MSAELKDYIRIKVRFSEVDSIKVVWHGSYIAYLEDGREAFGIKYGLGYMDMFAHGLTAPIADVKLQYRQPATVNDVLVLETTYVPTRGAKLEFHYNLYKLNDPSLPDEKAFSPSEDTHTLILTAQTVQLWMSGDVFEVSTPDFYREWKMSHGISKL